MKPELAASQCNQSLHTASVKVNHDNIITCEKLFRATLKDFNNIFNPVFSKYNQSLGRFKAVVKVGDENHHNAKVAYPSIQEIDWWNFKQK